MSGDLPVCPQPGSVIEIVAQEPSIVADALDFVLEPFQPLREQFTAITGLGLDFDDQNVAPRRLRIANAAEGGLSLLAVGRPDGRRVIFVHGSPGAGEEWTGFLADPREGLLYLAPDRPGFGENDLHESALQAQADALLPLLGPSSLPPVVLVGYSYGGPVALRLAADHPDRVGALMLVAAAADPGLEEIHPLQEIAALDFFAQMLPAELANSNAELLMLRQGLEQLAPELGRLQLPTTIIQGLSDTLVPPSNADYLRGQLPAEPGPVTILLQGADHFLPWTHHDLLAAALDCLIDRVDLQVPRSPPGGK